MPLWTRLHRRSAPAQQLGGSLFFPGLISGLILELLSGCQPRGALPGQAASAATPAPYSATARGPLPTGVNNAPGALLYSETDLRRYLDELMANIALKRVERLSVAVEPGEGPEEAHPKLYSPRLRENVDPIEAHFNAGEEFFEAELTTFTGYGDGFGTRYRQTHRVHSGAHGGPDSTSCRSCHHRGGDDGAGEYNENALTAGDGHSAFAAQERNPPALGGGGAIQILAAEITAELRKRVSAPYKDPIPVNLTVQGVDFGDVTLFPDGRVGTDKLTAIDPDLVVRPFGWKGTHSTLRRFAEEAFQVHHGLQSEALALRRTLFGTELFGASAATRAVLSQQGDGPPLDPDRDNIINELSSAKLQGIATYLTLLPLPVIDPPRSPDLLAAWRDGGAVFSAVGCASCHKPMWSIKNPVWTEHGDDEFTRTPLVLDLRKDIRNGPPLRNLDIVVLDYPVFIFSDLKRHDMGPELADKYPGPSAKAPHAGDRGSQGSAEKPIPSSYFLTRPLWGVADSGPYLHDGRALTLHDAIVQHGGEAQKAQQAYLALPAQKQRALQVFLMSLTRQALPEVAQ